MCFKYGKRLVLTPINDREQKKWNEFHRFLGPNWGLRAFYFWHKWFVKD